MNPDRWYVRLLYWLLGLKSPSKMFEAQAGAQVEAEWLSIMAYLSDVMDILRRIDHDEY